MSNYREDLAAFEAKVVEMAQFLATTRPGTRVEMTAQIRRRLHALERAMGEQLDDAVYAFVQDWKLEDGGYSPGDPLGAEDRAYLRERAMEAAARLIDHGVSVHSPVREIQDRPTRTTPSALTMMGHYDRGEERAKARERKARWNAEHAAEREAERLAALEECQAALTEEPGWSIFDVDTGHRIGPATVEQVEALRYTDPDEDIAEASPWLRDISRMAVQPTVNGFELEKPSAEIPILIYTIVRDDNPYNPAEAHRTALGRVSQIGWSYEFSKVRQGRKVVIKPVNPHVGYGQRAVFVRRNELNEPAE